MSMRYRLLRTRILAARTAALVCLAFAFQTYCSTALAEQTTTAKPLMLVTWFGTGAIALPAGQDWKPEMLTVYDKGTRPVAQLGCRDDAINPILEHDAKLVSKRVDGEMKTSVGEALATTSYLIDMSVAGGGHHQRNLFEFKVAHYRTSDNQ